jgi:putative DNA primase/helicase
MSNKRIKNNLNKTATTLQPVPKQMHNFITAVHGTSKDTAVWFQSYNKAPELTSDSKSFASVVNPDLRDQLVAANKKGMNVSVAVNRIDGKQRCSKNVAHINAVFIDIDNVEITLAQLKALDLPPDYVVCTSKNHYHAYWFVNDCKVAEFTPVQKALAARFGTDPNVCDLARVMRIPGTINWNYNLPCMAHVVHQIEREHVSIAHLINKLGLKVYVSAPAEGKANAPKINAQAVNTAPLTASKIAEIQAALDRLGADDRSLWLRAGMAIHSAAPNDEGYSLWCKWSKASEKYDKKIQLTTWNSFKPRDGVNIGTLFWLAKQAGGLVSFDALKLAELFVENYRLRLRYDAAMGNWYLFNGVAWAIDKQAPLRLAKKLVEDLCTGEVSKSTGLNAFRNPGGLGQIVHMAALELERIGIAERDFDVDHNLLAVKNGVVDLKTGRFRKARARDRLRRQADVEYANDAKCPRWEKFIHEVTKGDCDLAQFLRRAVGYTLFGHTRAQVFFVLEGKGSNGKGVFLRVLADLLGQYSAELAPNLITSAFSGNANASSSALVNLKGIRLGIVTELPNKRGFDTAFVKQFSGGDAITARANYGEQFTFKPEGKLWISTNSMPEIAANDHAMWRRIMPVPFRANFSYEKRDEELEETMLSGERSGILNWALAGAKEYAKRGSLTPCLAVDQHKSRLRRESDVVGSWLKDLCLPVKDAKVQSSTAYSSYSVYAKRLGKEPLGLPAFGTRLRDVGYAHKETNKYNCFVGLKLKNVAT